MFLTLTATCSLAVRLEGPEASKFFPSTSTAMVNTGTWTGPVWEMSLYCRPGFSWFRRIRAFMACGGSAFSSGAEWQKTRVFFCAMCANVHYKWIMNIWRTLTFLLQFLLLLVWILLISRLLLLHGAFHWRNIGCARWDLNYADKTKEQSQVSPSKRMDVLLHKKHETYLQPLHLTRVVNRSLTPWLSGHFWREWIHTEHFVQLSKSWKP